MDVTNDLSSRPLSKVEQIIWRLSEAASLNVAMIARVQGQLTPTVIRRALNVLQRQHGFLQVRVKNTPHGLIFLSDGVPEIPLEMANAEQDGWEPLVEAEINRPISWRVGPLARCVCIKHSDGQQHLVLTFHHVIGDGMSGVYLVRDLLTAVASAHLRDSSIEQFRAPAAMDQRLPVYARGWYGWGRGLAYQVVNKIADLRFGLPARIRMDMAVPPDGRRVRIISREFASSISDEILRRSRREGTTVHAALSAAMCLAVVDDMKSTQPVSVKFRTPVNVRQELEPGVGDDVGFFASMAFYRGRVAAQDNFWQLARRMRAHVKRDVERGLPCVLIRLMPMLYRLLRADQLTDQEFMWRWYEATPSTCGITNIGRLDIATQYGEVQLEALHFAVALSALADFSCTVSSLSGRLHCNFMCPEPVLSTSHAEELVSNIETRILQAVTQDAPV